MHFSIQQGALKDLIRLSSTVSNSKKIVILHLTENLETGKDIDVFRIFKVVYHLELMVQGE